MAGAVSLLAEHPDPKTGRIVGAEESPLIFAAGALIGLALIGLGVFLLVKAIRLSAAKNRW
jgi:hypothetical protein